MNLSLNIITTICMPLTQDYCAPDHNICVQVEQLINWSVLGLASDKYICL